tara:strand:- start:1947 stop:2111 length:165 start_codon:yes stop_codon:yes gene_type:complete
MKNIEADFSLKQSGKGGGNKKRDKDKKKTKGENIYNSKHIRIIIQKKENSKKNK